MGKTSQVRSEQAWNLSSRAPVVHMALSTGTGRTVVDDAAGTVYVLDTDGALECRTTLPQPVAGLCASGDGDAFAGVDTRGRITLFGPDGKHRWAIALGAGTVGLDLGDSARQVLVGKPPRSILLLSGRSVEKRFNCRHTVASLALAEGYGGCVVVAGEAGQISLLNQAGETCWMHDLKTRCGRMRVSNSASLITLPAYEQGVETFAFDGTGAGAFNVGQPVTAAAAAVSPLGTVVAVLTVRNTLILMDLAGLVLWHQSFERPVADFGISDDASLIVVAEQEGGLSALRLRYPLPGSAQSAPPAQHVSQDDEVGEGQQRRQTPSAKPRGVKQAGLLYKKRLTGGRVPRSTNALFVSPQGRFTVMALPDGRVAALDREGEVVACARMEPPGRIRKRRSDSALALWNPSVLVRLDLERGNASELQLGPHPAKDLDCSQPVDRVALIDTTDELVVLRMTGQTVARRKVGPHPVRLLMSPSGSTMLVRDARERFEFFDGEGNLTRKQQLAEDERCDHIVLENSFWALGAATGRLVTVDPQRGVLWAGKVTEEMARLESLDDTLAVYDASGRCLVVSPSGSILAEFSPPPGFSLLRMVPGAEPTLLHAQGSVVTAFEGRRMKLKAKWRFECKDGISLLEADRQGRFVAIVAGPRLYFVEAPQ